MIVSTLLLVASIAQNPPAASPAGAAQPARDAPPELLSSDPFDRITLVDNVTVEIEPLVPRPLPAFDPQAIRRIRARNENLPAAKREPEPQSKIVVRLLDPDADIKAYEVERTKIKQIDYFEDILVNAANEMTKARRYDRAFELLMRANTRDPKWRGLAEAIDRLLFEEGGAALTAGEVERGLRLLGDLARRQPEFPGLVDRLGDVYRNRIDIAVTNRDYVEAREQLKRAERVAARSAVIRDSRNRFIAESRALMIKAQSLPPSEKLDTLSDAARVWPDSEGLDAQLRAAFAACPTLDVAVVDAPDVVGPFPFGLGERRIADLMYAPVLASSDETATSGQAPGQLAAKFEKGELGRSARVVLKPGITWNDGRRPVDSADLAAALIARADPSSPSYSARWADLISKVEVDKDGGVLLNFARPAWKPEAWLLDPIPPAHGSADGWVWSDAENKSPVGDGIYTFEKADDEVLTLRRNAPAGRPGAPKIDRLRERVIDQFDLALEALKQGQVAMLEHVPPDRLEETRKVQGVTLGRYERPDLHAIAIDGRTPALRSRALRRGLSAAINRKALLEETVLRRPIDGNTLPADGPSIKGDVTDADAVTPLDSDPVLALMLIGAGQREMSLGSVNLKFEYPALPEVRAVVTKLIEGWKRANVKIDPIERSPSELERRLRSGERFDLAYRVIRPRDAVLDLGTNIAPAYDAAASVRPLESLPSPRILQLLLELEQSADVTTAGALAVRIDRECRDELPLLPLWQIDRYYAYAPARIKGPSEQMRSLYQGIAQWEATPWDPRAQ